MHAVFRFHFYSASFMSHLSVDKCYYQQQQQKMDSTVSKWLHFKNLYQNKMSLHSRHFGTLCSSESSLLDE